MKETKEKVHNPSPRSSREKLKELRMRERGREKDKNERGAEFSRDNK